MSSGDVATGLCKYCEGIDPEAIWTVYLEERQQSSMDYELRRSSSMKNSAQNGCSGCRFFLDVLRRDTHNAKAVDEALQREVRISIRGLSRLHIENTDIYDSFRLNLCLVQAEHDLTIPEIRSVIRRPIPVNPSSEHCMNMAKSWLERCASHEKCPPQAAVPLPTRLIEIFQENGECRLHTSVPGEKGHYVTLSHCWGPGGVKSFLKKGNHGQLQSTIDTENLPRSFQDAIIITRRLGFRFLWIDALCIIQDSVDDWTHESSQMAGTYRNGILMISAVAAPDSQYGILRPRDNLWSHRFGRNQAFAFQETSSNSFSFEENPDEPLHARGWCLQERIMAPRILHFSKQKLLWECVSHRWSEDHEFNNAYEWRSRYIDPRDAAIHFMWPPNPRLEDETRRAERLSAFYICITDFSKRTLTKRSDKLPAFSGLVSAFHIPEFGAYLAGLWESDLVYGLNWRTRTPEPYEDSPESKEYIAPSWSWASMSSRCEFLGHWYRVMKSDMLLNQVDFDENLRPRLLSHHIELATSNPYGGISAASIKLRGFIRSLLVRPYRAASRSEKKAGRGLLLDRWLDPEVGHGFSWMFGPPHEFVPKASRRKWNTSSATDDHEVREFIALPVGMTNGGAMSVIVLDSVDGMENTFRRVGHVTMFAENDVTDPAKWEQRDLTLI